MKNIIFQILGLIIVVIIVFGYYRNYKQKNLWNWTGVVTQSSPYSCGASALLMIFKAHKISVELKEIENAIVKPGIGSTFLDLKRFSEIKGLNASGWRLSFEDLEEISMPVIIFIDRSHFVVMDSVKFNSVYLRDPLQGNLVIKKEKFLTQWDGEVLKFD